jgi:hypothetical protein
MAGAARVLGAYRIRTGEGAGEREAESGDEGSEDRLICSPWGPWCPAFQQKESWGNLFHSLATQKAKLGQPPRIAISPGNYKPVEGSAV